MDQSPQDSTPQLHLDRAESTASYALDSARRRSGLLLGRAKQKVIGLLRQCQITIDGPAASDIHVLDERFYPRVLVDGALGLGESYMDGWWTARDLDGFIYRVLRGQLHKRVTSWRDLAAYASAVVFNHQSRSRSSEVGERHYDLGNDLYEAMLDSRMIYSCAYWQSASTLDNAQEDKLQLVFRKLGLRSGQRILDIGCGWGGALQLAAERYGVEGVGTTISEEQFELGRVRCARLPIDIRLEDYRALQGSFDHIYSIGMLEHVGAKNYRTYMQIARRHLKPQGRFLVHTIGTTDSVGRPDPWLDKYIFPNSVLPSQRQIVAAIDGLFLIEGWQRIGVHYDQTLLAWRSNFERHWPQLCTRRDERFFRMWRYYLSACAGAFRAGTIDVWQVLLAPIP